MDRIVAGTRTDSEESYIIVYNADQTKLAAWVVNDWLNDKTLEFDAVNAADLCHEIDNQATQTRHKQRLGGTP